MIIFVGYIRQGVGCAIGKGINGVTVSIADGEGTVVITVRHGNDIGPLALATAVVDVISIDINIGIPEDGGITCRKILRCLQNKG